MNRAQADVCLRVRTCEDLSFNLGSSSFLLGKVCEKTEVKGPKSSIKKLTKLAQLKELSISIAWGSCVGYFDFR